MKGDAMQTISYGTWFVYSKEAGCMMNTSTTINIMWLYTPETLPRIEGYTEDTNNVSLFVNYSC